MNQSIKAKAALACVMLLTATQLLRGQAQATIPAAEQQAKAWLAAFNSGDRATLLDYLKTNYPSFAEHVDDELGFRAMTGGFQLIKMEESTPSRFAALVKEKDSDQFGRLVVEVEPALPHRISKFELRAIATPAEFATPRMSQPDAIAWDGGFRTGLWNG